MSNLSNLIFWVYIILSNISKLIILSNLEAMNSLLIEKNISSSKRLVILNNAAKSQIKILAREKQKMLKQ